MKAFVLTVSDGSARANARTRAAPGAQLLSDAGFTVTTAVVTDDAEAIRAALLGAVSNGDDLVVTTGGTGLSPRDVSPRPPRS